MAGLTRPQPASAMSSSEQDLTPQLMRGIGSVALGYSLFSVQDATVKWLVATYAVPQVLFTRSLVIIAFALYLGGARRSMADLAQSRAKFSLFARAALILIAWLSYYTAARSLGLAQLTTIYFASPIVVVVLSVFILRERVSAVRWLAVLTGFGGVVLASNPTGTLNLGPAGLALFAACCWGLSVILVRLINRSETTSLQMLVSNSFFAITCGATLYWTWKTPDLFGLALMIGLGVAGGLGQFFLYEGFRSAPASVVAPIEYTGLVWAFIYGYLIWSDVPAPSVFAGAICIVGSTLALIWFERRRAGQASAFES